MKKYIILFLFLFLFVKNVFPSDFERDEYGGWTKIQSPVGLQLVINPNKDGSANATSVSATTLTDTTRNWAVDSLAGMNLQPNINNNIYFEIISNTSNTITVLESDRTLTNYRGIDDYNDGNDEYRVLYDWKIEKIGKRYWIIDPLANVFLIIGINNMWDGTGNNGKGVDVHGNTLNGILTRKYGSFNPNEAGRIPDIKNFGFNSLVEYINPALYPGTDSDVTSEYYLEYLHLFRPTVYWNLTNVEKLKGSVFFDVFDPDYINDFGSTSDGYMFDDLTTTQNSYNLTPYKSGWKNCAANPYCLGAKMEDEPTTHTSSHEGFRFFIKDIESGEEVSETKAFFVNYLRAKYTDGDESTFVSNISYDGTNETYIYSSWDSVTGYVSSAKDTSALNNLNTAWETSYGSWEEVYKEDYSNVELAKTGSSNISFSGDTVSISGDTWELFYNYVEVSNTYGVNDGTYLIKSYEPGTITLDDAVEMTANANTSARIQMGVYPAVNTVQGSSNISFNNTNPDTITYTSNTWGFVPIYIKINNTSNNNGIYKILKYTNNSIEIEGDFTTENNTSATISPLGQIYGKLKNYNNNTITDTMFSGSNSQLYSSDPAQILTDFDKMAEYYWRRSFSTYYDKFNEYFKGFKLNTTFKISLEQGNHHAQHARWLGGHSEDYSIKYINMPTCFTDFTTIAEWSAETDTPCWNNSYWVQAEIDSPRGEQGTVTEIQYTTLISGVTDASGNTGVTVVDTDTGDTTVIDRSSNYGASTLYLGDNACSSVYCATVFCNTTAEPDVCSNVAFDGKVSNTEITLTDSGVTGNLINYELRSYNVLYDQNTSFFNGYDVSSERAKRLWYTSGAEKYLTTKSFALGEDPNSYSYMIPLLTTSDDEHKIRITGFGTGGYFTCENTHGVYSYGERNTDLRNILSAGDEYIIGPGFYYSGCSSDKIGNLSQEERADYYFDKLYTFFRYKNNDGDYYFLGIGWFDIWDVGAGYNEGANYGWFTYSDNAYDGIEATILGQDGIASTADDEIDNYGDFVTKASEAQRAIYRTANPGIHIPSSNFNGITFR